MTIQQAFAALVAWIQKASQETVNQMMAFLDVTVGEIAWVAAALGYPSAPVNFSGIVGQLTTLQSNIDTMETQLLALQASIDTLGTPLQATDPVTLPVTPPSGYGSTDPAALADEVWAHTELTDTVTMGQVQFQNYERNMYAWFYNGWHYPFQPFLKLLGTYLVWDNTTALPAGEAPLDYTTILQTDANAHDWVLRAYPAYAWGTDVFAGFGYADPGMNGGYWQLDLIQSDFDALKSRLAPTTSLAAPVWPGLADVTLGTPVALDLAVNVNEPMDGVLIALTAVTPAKPYYIIGDQTATAHIGQIAFVDDNGDMEYPQNLSFVNQLYVPLHMAHAAGVKIRTILGVSGSVTPWTVT
jgi:hypothetical protein